MSVRSIVEEVQQFGCYPSQNCANSYFHKQVQRLQNAIRAYDNDRWRAISAKVGNGVSPAACKAKADEFDDEEGIVEAVSPHEEDDI